MMVWTRPFNPVDVPAMVEMVQEAFTEVYPSHLWADIAGYWPDGFLILLDGNEQIGALVGVMDSESTARILILVVRPQHRGRKYGETLLERFYEACLDRGIRNVTLEVRKTNDGAIKFYEARGFKIVRELPCFYTDGADAWQMQRSVDLPEKRGP